jgi:hypothetical protein
MALRLFGLNTILLSRLHSPAKERSLPLHGWGATLESSRVYGWGHTFFGPLSGTGAALLAAKLKHREAFFEAGQTYDVSFTLDDTRQELTVIVNGEMAHRARYLPFESLNDRIQLFIPMPHEIRALEIEGILREE